MSKRLKLLLPFALAAGFACAFATATAASTYTKLHDFCGSASCTDGKFPQDPILKHGHSLYGVAGGGAHGHGMVYRYNLNTNNFTDIYDMCSSTLAGSGNCKDGDQPTGALIADADGNLYGVTQLGGATNAGMVYELIKPATGMIWTFKRLHTFCASCSDGNDPFTGLAYAGQAAGNDYDGTSNLFGATLVGGYVGGGSLQGHGVVYELMNNAGTWSEKVIHTFCSGCSDSCGSCSDGIEPVGNLYMDALNRLWGVTIAGGTDTMGIAFELAPSGDLWADPWVHTVIYNFCWNGASKCTDGAQPTGIVLDASGNVWGTTGIGGSGSGSTGSGTVFELTNSSCTEGGTATFWCDTVRHNFCASAGCPDGQYPGVAENLVVDGSGIFYGTATAGGAHGQGVIFEQNGSTYTDLHDFCASASCTDGAAPYTGVTLDASTGILYGNTAFGGANTWGIFFEWSP